MCIRDSFAALLQSALSLEEAERMIEPAIAGAERLGDRGLILDSITVLAAIVADRGRVVQALILLDGVARQAEAVGRSDLADRARSNFAVWSMDDDPVAALAAYRVNMEHERRTGDLRALLLSVANAAEIALAAGDWDRPLEEAAALLRDDLEVADWVLITEQLTIVALMRGDPAGTAMLDQALAHASGNQSLGDLLDDRVAFAAWIAGDVETAIRSWRHYAEWSPLNAPATLPRAARAGLWVGDLESVRHDLDATIATGVHGTVIDAQLVTLRAGIAALEGRVDDSRIHYRDALTRWRELRQEWLEALTCLDLVSLLGPDDPDAPAAADRAREVFERLGARPFLERLDAALADGGRAAAPRGRRSARADAASPAGSSPA